MNGTWSSSTIRATGGIELGRHYLLTANSDPEKLLNTAVPTGNLALQIASSSVKLALILIDTCYAGSGLGDIGEVISGIRKLFSGENEGVFVIAATRPKEEADQGALVEALTSVINDGAEAGVQQEFFEPTAVSRAINRYFLKKGCRQRSIAQVTEVASEEPPFFPNPRYRPFLPIGVDLKSQERLSSMDPADISSHWGPRGRGVEIQSQAGWYFAGRTRILRELVQWLKTPSADAMPQVITGGPGVGKSAVLARLVTMADPGYRAQAPLQDVDPDTIPPKGCIDVAIHAKGKTRAELVRAISQATGGHTEDTEELVHDLGKRHDPFTIVIDALDEAREPELIADKVLRALSPLTTVRLLIGTRKEVISSLGSHVAVKYLDREYYQPEDIRDYVKLRLLARDEPEIVTPYRDKTELAGKVAEVVAGRAKTVFLIARLICEDLIQAKQTVDPQSNEWRQSLPDSVASAFGDYLNRFGAQERKVRDLLLPLAYAEGQGLPWSNLWAPLASALSGRAYTDEDVAWVRDKAGAYIVEALQSGQSVYRLYHQALADYFHNDGLDKDRHRAIAEALIASVPNRTSKMWQEAHLYVLQHLSTHAARGGILCRLVRDPLYLIVADPARLLVAMDHSASTLPAEIIGVYKQTSHRLHDAAIEEKASYLELSARKQGAFDMADQIASLPLARRWVPRWASWVRSHIHRLLEGHTDSVSSVALGRLGESEVVVSGSFDETVRIWDVSTGKELQLLEGHTGWVNSVALGRVEGRDVVVSASNDRTVRIWDASTGKTIKKLMDRNSYVEPISMVVALGQFGERAVVVSGSLDGRVRVWDACTGEIFWRLKGHTGPVTSVVLGRLGEHEVVVSGSLDTKNPFRASKAHENALRRGERDFVFPVSNATVRVWEASTGKTISDRIWRWLCSQFTGVSEASTGKTIRELKVRSGSVCSVALGRLGESEVVVSLSYGGEVRVWEASTGKMIREFNSTSAASLALGQLDGGEVVVCGGADTIVRVFEASSGKVLQVLKGHTGKVNSVALGRLGESEVIVSGSDDHTIRVWEASTGAALQVLKGHTGRVNSVALGRLAGREVVVSGSDDGTVRVWEALAGEAIRELAGTSVAVGRLGGREVIAASNQGAIRVWEASTGKALRVLKGRSLACVALGRLEEHEVIVSGSYYGRDGVRIWEASTGEMLQVIKGRFYKVRSVALGQLCGREVVVFGSYQVFDRLGAIQRAACIVACMIINTVLGTTYNVAGKFISSKWTIRVFEPSRGPKAPQVLRAFEGHTDAVNSIALGQLGGRDVIVSGSDDGTVRIWGLEPNSISGPIFMGASVSSIALSGTNIVVGTSAGIAVLELKLGLP